MDFSAIDNSDVRKFFQHREQSLAYKSATPFSELFADDPWRTYKNFKTKTHLPWMPLDLKKLARDFPASAILEEARSLEHLAVSHKNYDGGTKGWKSLCIHGLDSQSTLSCDEYGYKFDHETPYKWTEASEHCPITTLYFKNIFPHTRYNRLRFMYLEPGGYIAPHEDVIDPQPHFTAINIAVNQPKDCVFLMGSPDLDSNTRWGHVPFYKGGDCFWLDLRNHHSVINLSTETRVHIIVHFLLNSEDTLNLNRFISLIPKVEPQRISKKTGESKKLNFAFGFWQPQLDSFQEGLQPYTELTERFSKSMESAIELKKIIYTQSIDEILIQAAESLESEYLLFFGPGQIIHKNESFWKELYRELENPENQNVALWAHIIDKGGESYLALHPQLFCLNLKKYRKYGTGHFGMGTDAMKQLRAWSRSDDNVHDDYTPLFVKPQGQLLNAKIHRDGWSLISETLDANYEIRNFSQFIRDTKIHGYPEENFAELAQFSGNNIYNKIPQEGPLFEGQVTFLKWLKEEVDSISSNIWIYNNESIKRCPESLINSHVGFIAGPAAGNWDFSYYCQLQQKKDFRFIHFDSSLPNLNFKKSIIYELKNEPFKLFLLKSLRKLPHTVTVSEKQPLRSEYDYDQIRRHPLWLNYLAAEHRFINQDLFKDPAELVSQIPAHEAGILNLSNIFHFLPSLWLYSEKETYFAFLNLLKKIKEKNNDVMIIGKDPLNRPIFFEKVDALIQRLAKNIG